jgi:transcriptional/translational regulatory protein YebC/TACO1
MRFAPYGVAMLVHTTSDNANRTVSEVKNLIEMHGGKMGGQGSVSYLFQKCGLVEFEAQENTEDRVMAFAEAMNAFDIDRVGDTYYVYVPFDSFGRIKDSLEGMKAKSTEIDYRPTTTVMIEDDKNARRILAIIEALEELDDVQRVFSNLEVPDSFDVTA